jgi:excisionase family DNA binding protein
MVACLATTGARLLTPTGAPAASIGLLAGSPGEPAEPETSEDSALKVTILPYSAFHSNAAAGAMATRPPKTDILMIKDVAEYLKVTERTIYRLAAAKKIPAFKVGGSWRFSRADLDAWIRRQSLDVNTGLPAEAKAWTGCELSESYEAVPHDLACAAGEQAKKGDHMQNTSVGAKRPRSSRGPDD